MSFCILEKDQKTFFYFKTYFEWLDYKNESCYKLDNIIQYEEIKNHLIKNGYSENDISEANKWIEQNGKKFRDYLNTIKMIYICNKFTDKNDITWEDFCRMSDILNSMKEKCLDTIF